MSERDTLAGADHGDYLILHQNGGSPKHLLQYNSLIMLSYSSTIVTTTQQVSCDLNGEATILCLKNGKYYGLSQVGARIWELLAEEKTIQELHSALIQEYDVDAEQCRQDLLEIVRKLSVEGLVEIVHE